MKRFQPQGVALATALLLMALILVIGLAVATSSMMSLNLARQDYMETHCSLLARSAVNELIGRLGALESTQALQLYNPRPVDLQAKFPGRTELMPGCWVTFDSRQDGYSTDNSAGDVAVAGWLDRGASTRSVPQFTLELILHTEFGSYHRSYRALVRRVWPYAIYSGGGPVVLGGDPRFPGGGSQVAGRLYSAVCPNFTPAVPNDPRSFLFQRFIGGLQPERDFTSPLQLGPPVKVYRDPYQISGTPNPGRPDDVPAKYLVEKGDDPSFDPMTDTGNALRGGVVYSETPRRAREARVYPGNSWQGGLTYRATPVRNPLDTFVPGDTTGFRDFVPPGRLSSVWGPSGGWAYAVLPWPARPNVTYQDTGDRPTFVLWGAHNLANGTYVVGGHLVNRLIAEGRPVNLYPEDIPVDEYKFGLSLTDCLLHVKGDLDLCDLTGDDSSLTGITGIFGNGATLIVDGTMALTGAQLKAGDRGLVIYARSIMLSGECDFSGMLVASQSITIIPRGGKHIRIRGGIVTAAGSDISGSPGIVICNSEIQYDPRYLKSLNAFGDYTLTGWEPL